MYQGVANYPTFIVGVWIDNDEQLLSHVRAETDRAWSKARHDEDRSMSARFALAAELQEYLEELRENAPSLPMPFGDLLTAAMEEVNWREVADGYLSSWVSQYVAKSVAA